jgi:hypothetical protein
MLLFIGVQVNDLEEIVEQRATHSRITTSRPRQPHAGHFVARTATRGKPPGSAGADLEIVDSRNVDPTRGVPRLDSSSSHLGCCTPADDEALTLDA